MVRAITTDTEINPPVEKLETNFGEWQSRARIAIDEAAKEVAEEFLQVLKENIKNTGIDEQTSEFINSWEVHPRGNASYRIRSDGESQLALLLEIGSDEHDIDGNNWLKFTPEDSSEYPNREFRRDDDGIIRGDFAEDGMIQSPLDPLYEGGGDYIAKRVEHPGTRPYKYFKFTEERKDWSARLDEKIKQKMTKVNSEF